MTMPRWYVRNRRTIHGFAGLMGIGVVLLLLLFQIRGCGQQVETKDLYRPMDRPSEHGRVVVQPHEAQQ
ncbi:MAG: hypothetical protein AUJ55_09595 [Proteobacteria bacterium CG1_02_64_396]|nr:MAG: hypothetical protein AUJ55_09595 [Proteobacteria bacterium CG1_02_64_396]